MSYEFIIKIEQYLWRTAVGGRESVCVNNSDHAVKEQLRNSP